MREVVIKPDYPNVLRYMATGLSDHSFRPGERSPVGSVMQIAIHLYNENPAEMMNILKEFDAPLRKEDSNANPNGKGKADEAEGGSNGSAGSDSHAGPEEATSPSG